MNMGSEFVFDMVEFYTVNAKESLSFNGRRKCILKEFITKHNDPNHVPDELVECSSQDDEVPKKPNVKSKETKMN
ncbi:hypothetical protein ES332_A07G149000v1 [Gossypium tomentosum]|nr:hypothetical protein ES332_A07G149000v1 [Gossypium tomentosum]